MAAANGKIQLLASTSHVMTFVPGLQFSIYTRIVLSKNPTAPLCLSLFHTQIYTDKAKLS